MSQSNKQLIDRYYEEFWNNRKRNIADQLFCDDLRFQGSLGVKTIGKEPFLAHMDSILHAVPDLYHCVEFILVDEEKGVARTVYVGKHQGELAGYAATHHKICFEGATFFQFEHKMISDIYVIGDTGSLFQQLHSA
jgi:steroid delta-isomerase-like uncharacterized protein